MTTDARPLWMEIADIRTDDALEAKTRAILDRVEREGGCSELMTAVVSTLGDALTELKRRRFTLRATVRNEAPTELAETPQGETK